MAFENYVYPPRPEKKLPQTSLQAFDNMKKFIAQAKLNGSCCVAIVNAEKVNFYNRHKETFAKHNFNFAGQELRNQFVEQGLTIFCGEYLNKSQKDEKGENSNGRLVLFDIIRYDGNNLVGKTFDERQVILHKIFKTESYNRWIDRVSANLFIVKNFETGFVNLYNELVQHQVYEGLVLKNRAAKLEPGTTEKNNMTWQVKCRKETKNYTF